MSDNQAAEKPSLRDPEVVPDAEILRSELGVAYPAYAAWLTAIDSEPYGMAPEWRHYKDGGCWLCKLTRKKKTVCWLSVWPGSFKIGFYFTEKTAAGIPELPISEAKKKEFAEGQSIGKLMHLGFEVRTIADLDEVLAAAAYKISVSK